MSFSRRFFSLSLIIHVRNCSIDSRLPIESKEIGQTDRAQSCRRRTQKRHRECFNQLTLAMPDSCVSYETGPIAITSNGIVIDKCARTCS